MSSHAGVDGKRRRVLMVAFHFPPLKGSSGMQRTLGFCRHLPTAGWEPAVLTAHPRAYPMRSPAGEAPGLPNLRVERAFALDAARHLALFGKYPRWLALPDRWVSWWAGAVWRGRRMIAEQRPDLLWSTSPIATAHLVGLTLQRWSGLPWVADLRDPMTEPDYPADPLVFRAHRRIEQRIMSRASRIVTVTPGTLQMYRDRYPEVAAERLSCIENGYEERDFDSAGVDKPRRGDRTVKLLHSGTIYRRERDPEPLFHAVAGLVKLGHLQPGELQITLRASGEESEYRQRIDDLGLAHSIRLAPDVPYRTALAEMQAADGLMVLQGPACNSQIPAKAYEYLRAGRPILALTDPAGDTARLLRGCGVAHLAPIDDVAKIQATLMEFIAALRSDREPLPDAGTVLRLSRAGRARELAALFDSVLAGSLIAGRPIRIKYRS